jgi:hypothetical protein
MARVKSPKRQATTVGLAKLAEELRKNGSVSTCGAR